jgi:hypothetical protein
MGSFFRHVGRCVTQECSACGALRLCRHKGIDWRSLAMCVAGCRLPRDKATPLIARLLLLVAYRGCSWSRSELSFGPHDGLPQNTCNAAPLLKARAALQTLREGFVVSHRQFSTVSQVTSLFSYHPALYVLSYRPPDCNKLRRCYVEPYSLVGVL